VTRAGDVGGGPDITVTTAGTPDLPLLRVRTPDLELVFAPTRGGRLLSLVAGGRERLWRDPALVGDDLAPVVPVASWPASDGDMSTWANVGGSKTWPAPQGWSGADEWAGPPDQVLDSGAYALEWAVDEAGDGAAVVTLTSGDDARSGLRVERRFTVPATGTEFAQTARFTNVSSTPRTWSLWEVCQVVTAKGAGRPVEEAAVHVPHDAEPVELDLGTWEGDVTSVRSGTDVLLPVGTGVAKRGYPDAAGTVSYRDVDGSTLTLATAPPTRGTWPDGGSKVEVWLQRPTACPIRDLGDLHPSAHLVELEVLGPLTTLAPGGATSLEIRWSFVA